MYVELEQQHVIHLSSRAASTASRPYISSHMLIIKYPYSRLSIESYLFLNLPTAVSGGCGCCIAGELAVVPYTTIHHAYAL